VRRLEERGVGGDPVSLGEHEHVAADDLSSRDAPPRPPADDQRARACEVPQGGHGALGLALLEERDADHDEHEEEEGERLREVAQEEVDPACGEEQEDRRLLQHIRERGREARLPVLGQLVGPVALETGGALGLAEPPHQ
jgi:hypothetical protein